MWGHLGNDCVHPAFTMSYGKWSTPLQFIAAESVLFFQSGTQGTLVHFNVVSSPGELRKQTSATLLPGKDLSEDNQCQQNQGNRTS